MPPSGAHGSIAQRVQRLAAHDVADARRDASGRAEPRRSHVWRRALAGTPHGDRDLRVVVEQVGPEAAQGGVEGDARAIEQFEHRARRTGRRTIPFAASASQALRGERAQRRPSGIDVPRAGHAQVRVEDAAVVEAREQMLATRLDRLQHAPVQRLGESVTATGSPVPAAATRWPTSGAMRSAASSRCAPRAGLAPRAQRQALRARRRIRRP